MPTFYLPPSAVRRPQRDPMDAAGADVAFAGGLVVANGEYQLVRKDAAAQQSVLREAACPAGGFARRPEWGIGATDLVFRGATRATIQRLAAKARSRMAANPRVARVLQVAAERLDTNNGTSLTMRYVPAGSQNATTSVVGDKR